MLTPGSKSCNCPYWEIFVSEPGSQRETAWEDRVQYVSIPTARLFHLSSTQMCSATVKRSAFCRRAIWSGRHVNCATYSSIQASVSFVPTKLKRKFTGSATDAKGPIVHGGLLTAMGWRAKGKLSCSDVTHGARDNTVKRDSQRWEHAAALCFHLTTLEGPPFVGVSGFASDAQRPRSHASYELINKTNPLSVTIFFPLSRLASPSPAVFQCTHLPHQLCHLLLPFQLRTGVEKLIRPLRGSALLGSLASGRVYKYTFVHFKVNVGLRSWWECSA